MKTFFWVLVLGGVAYLLYHRVKTFGYPWEPQVVITHYESNKRSMGGSEEIYVFGEIENRTRRPLQATVTCVAVPGGATLSARTETELMLKANERAPFSLSVSSRTGAQGAECRIKSWRVEGGLEGKLVKSAQSFFDRIKRLF